MLRYSVHQLFLEGTRRYYLPLPKLTSQQLLIVAKHMVKNGFRITPGHDCLRASRGDRRVHVDQSGVAWSNMDILDTLAPCIPELLLAKKAECARNPFFIWKKGEGIFQVQLFPRMETRRTWKELRRAGGCALTPDEYQMVRMLLESADGRLRVVTDYPVEGCQVMRIGRRNYFRAELAVAEFGATLGVLGAAGPKRSYLPANGLLAFQEFEMPSPRRLNTIFEELGEWCFVTPSVDKSL